MKKLFFTLLLALPFTAQSQYRGWDVINSQPVYESHVTYHNEYVCYDNYINHDSSTTGHAIVGGLVGGAVGRQFGGGRGRDASTIVGVIAGAHIGQQHARNYNRRYGGYQHQQQCSYQSVPRQYRELTGYYVTYRTYNGRTIRRFEPIHN